MHRDNPVAERVKPDMSRAHASAFSDPELFEREMAQIFRKEWLLLGHRSELAKPGDYIVRPMGNDQVILQLGEDLILRAFLNACSHRGMPLARADHGCTRRFVCPYHGWTYDTQGVLCTTSYDQHYDKCAFDSHALLAVPRLEEWKGLIFGSWDPQVRPLEEHLGDMRWYLETVFARTPGGMTVLGAPLRWVINTNWKIPSLNFMDPQHALRTHKGPLALQHKAGGPPVAVLSQVADQSPQAAFPNGHGVVMRPGDRLLGMPPYFGYLESLVPMFEKVLKPEQLDQMREAPPSVGTIFPNISWVESLLSVEADQPPRVFLSLRNWHPLGPNQTEVWSWYLAEAEASEEARSAALRLGLGSFGAGGIFEEDDAAVWSAIQQTLGGAHASNRWCDYSGGLDTVKPVPYRGPGEVYPSLLSEHLQRNWLRHWSEVVR